MRGFKHIQKELTASLVALMLALTSQIDFVLADDITAIHYRNGRVDKRVDGKIRNLVRRCNPDEATDSLSGLLTDEGFIGNNVSIANDTMIVDMGERYRIGPVEITVVDADGNVETEMTSQYENVYATKENILKLRADILSEFQRQGYYFVSLNTDSIKLHQAEIMLTLRLITGPVVEIERIRFKGLSKSKPDFVAKLSGLREGDPFSRDRLDGAIRKIETGGYLRNDSMPRLAPNKDYDGVELLFYLTEMKSNSLELGGGYLPSQGEQTGELIGRLNFRSSNLFGSGRRIDLLLDRKDRASSRVEFRFIQPFFIPDHLEVGTHLTQIDYDSSYYAFTIDGSLSLITHGHTILTGGASWTKTEPQRSSQPPSRSLSGVLGFETNKLDYPPNPVAGRKLKIRFSYIRRLSWPDTAATTVINNETMFSIAVDNYIRLHTRFVIRTNLEGNVLITRRELIDFSEQFKLGGFGSLRGYREDQFAGRRTFLGQLEMRYRPSRLAAVYIFGDVGVVYNKKEVLGGGVASQEFARPGSGIGLFVGSGNARLTMEVGWGRHDRLGEGKVHLRLMTMF